MVSIRIFLILLLSVQSTFALAAPEDWKQVDGSMDAIAADAKKIWVVTPVYNQIVVHALPKGWKAAWENQTRNSYAKEYVPSGQSVQDWREMLTLQGFKGFASVPQASPELFLKGIADHHRRVCGEKAVFLPVGERTISSFKGAAAIIGCAGVPTNQAVGTKTGQGEIGYFLAVRGAIDLYVIHKAIRSNEFSPQSPPLTLERISEFMKDIEPIKICDRSMSPVQCIENPSE